MKKLSLAMAMAMVGTVLARSVEPHEAPSLATRGDDDIVHLQSALLDDETVDAVIQQLDRNPSIKQLWLIDIPGGYSTATSRLAWRARSLEIFVAGGCLSGCARVALAGKALTLVVDERRFSMATLGIHGMFGARTGSWSPRSLDYLDFFAERLAPIPRADVETALSYTHREGAGLFFSVRRDAAGAMTENLLLCERLPSECRRLPFRLGDLRISSAFQAPPAARRPAPAAGVSNP